MSTTSHDLPTVGPDTADVEALTDLLDLMRDFPSNEQRARYLLSSNWMRDRGAAAADHVRRRSATYAPNGPLAELGAELRESIESHEASA